MADDDSDTIWVDVKARLDEGSADEVESTLRDKLKSATEGVTDGLKDLGGKVGDTLKDALSKDLPKGVSDAFESQFEGIADELGKKIGGAVGRGINDLGKSVGLPDLGEVAGTVRELDDAVGGLGDKLGALKGLGGKDVSGGLGALTDLLGGGGKTFGGDLGETLSGASDFLHQLQPIAEGIQGLKGFKTGDLQGGLSGLQGILGGADGLLGNQPHSDSIISKILGVTEDAGVGAAIGAAIPGLGETGIPEVIGGLVGGGKGIYDRFFDQPSAPAAQAEPPDAYAHSFYSSVFGNSPLSSGIAEGGSDASSPLYSGSGGLSGGGGGSLSTSANEVDVQAGDAVISAGSVTLGGNISLPGGLTSGSSGGASASSGLIGKGAGGGSSASSSSGSGSGDGYASLGSYSQGGDITGPGPDGVDSVLAMLAPGETVLNTSEAQVWKSLMGQGIPHFAGGGDVAAPAAPSGESVDLGGGDSDSGGASDSGDGGSSDQGGDGGAPGTVSGTEAPGSVQDAADQAPQGESVDTSITDPAQTSLAGGTKTSKGIQDQSFGYGKGFQVTGQGLIGFAESAPGAIASAVGSGLGYDGSGAATGAATAALTSLWNTVGEPELNEAVTEGVKVGADLASAPQQEFAVGGENFQNWSQKLIGGEIGNVTNLINTAANTQAPLTSEDGTGSAGQAAQPSGTLGGQPSPQGTPGDPIHVMPVGGASGSSQSSSMSSIGTDSSGTA